MLSDGTQQRIRRRTKPTVITTTHKSGVHSGGRNEDIDDDNPSSPVM